jgi:hypothetical protein
MINNVTTIALQKSAKVAGFMFLYILIGSILYGTLILAKLTITGNSIAAANNILANELLFRFSIICELFITSAGGIILALALYMILKSINKYLALLALCLKLTEAILGAVIALISFIVLQILKDQTIEQTQAIAGILINSQVTITAIPMLFLGMNFMLFFYLLFKSKYVPGILPIFGIISYLLIFICALITILTPQYITMIIQSVFWGPSIIFELVIGIWLLVKGINV